MRRTSAKYHTYKGRKTQYVRMAVYLTQKHYLLFFVQLSRDMRTKYTPSITLPGRFTYAIILENGFPIAEEAEIPLKYHPGRRRHGNDEGIQGVCG